MILSLQFLTTMTSTAPVINAAEVDSVAQKIKLLKSLEGAWFLGTID